MANLKKKLTKIQKIEKQILVAVTNAQKVGYTIVDGSMIGRPFCLCPMQAVARNTNCIPHDYIGVAAQELNIKVDYVNLFIVGFDVGYDLKSNYGRLGRKLRNKLLPT